MIKLGNQLFFSDLHTIYIEGFLELTISCYLTLKAGVTEPLGETISMMITYFSLIVVFV